MQYKTFGEWLRHYRLQKDISPFKMAESLGYKRVSAIYNFEYGIAPLPISKWPAMAAVLQLSLDEFLEIMERFSEEKVAEFRLIRDTAHASSGTHLVKGGGTDDAGESVTLFEPAADLMQDQNLKCYGIESAETVLIARETADGSLLKAVDDFRRRQSKRLGLVLVAEGVSFPAAAAVSVLKEAKVLCVLEADGRQEPRSVLAAQLKGAFLDALTGAGDYPEIHRVPRICSVLIEPSLEEWTGQRIGYILQYFQEDDRRRQLTVKVEQAVPFSIKRH